MKFLSRLHLLRPALVGQPDLGAPPPAEVPFCVIGDPHGRHDLLMQMLEKLARRPDAAALRVICAGDMVDRGPESAAVLHHLKRLGDTPAPFAQVLCLRGNHEEMLLNFLGNPERHGPRWLTAGGAETLMSFGLSPYRVGGGETETDTAPLVALRDRFAKTLGADLHKWLKDLPLMWREGKWAVTHAGADPRKPLDAQPDAALVWGHGKFYRQVRQDGIWVAHGHRIMPEATIAKGRVAVDTGAYRSNRLSAAVMTSAGVELLQVSPSDQNDV